MAQTALHIISVQQPDTTASTAHSVDTAQAVKAIRPKVYNEVEHYSTVIPETLIRPHDSIFQPKVDTAQFLTMCNDSLLAPYSENPVQHRESMFATNTLSQPTTHPAPHNTSPNLDWVFATIILLLALISIYVNNQKFKIKDIFLSLFDTRVLDRVSRENNIRITSLLPMAGIYLASIALVVLKATQTYSITSLPMAPPLFFIVTLTALIIFILLKNSLIRLMGDIFEDRSATMLYIFSSDLFYFVGGLVSTPLLLFLFFCTQAQTAIQKIAIFFIAILFIIRFLRGIQLILTNSKTSKLYLFYYLCIFEIIPIIVIAKLVLV